MSWQWEQIDATRSGSSGDISKLFKNERIKRPGIIGPGAPRADATIMAREVIQNSWDAARDLRRMLDGQEHPDFDIDFRFDRLRDASLRRVRETAKLDELQDRAARLRDDWSKVGIPPDSCLVQPIEEHLDVLVIEERGASGMYGPWKGAKSKMYLALVSIGFTEKLTGAGGSYGYGKAGLIRGSKTRTVIAYSSFLEQDDDPGVTRRLLGMTYWGPHDLDGRSYTGFARLGDSQSGHVDPLVNDEADEFAVQLGLDRREVDGGADQLGTTFLVIDPTVAPHELSRAVERNWWPALQSDRTFGVEIVDSEGERHTPRPKQASELTDFIRGFEIARMRQDNNVATERRVAFQPATVEGERYELGALGLVGNPKGWSYPPADDDVDHRSLVALVRGPKMVVEYFDAGRAKPYVRGAFIAADEVDDLLRQTEPRGHDAWETEPGDDSIDVAAPEVADAVLRRIKNNVQQFRRELKPPMPDRREIRLPELEDLFRSVIEGEGPKPPAPPPGPPRLVAISIHEQRPEQDPTDESRIRLRARVSYHLSDNWTRSDAATVALSLRYKFLEDDRAGQECRLMFDVPEGFRRRDDHTVVGTLTREPLEIFAVSDPYDHDWSGRLVVEADVIEASEGTAA